MPTELAEYDRWVKTHPEGNLWQSLEWKRFQESIGREVRIYKNETASALVVIDKTAGGYSTWEIRRGPIMSESGIGNWEFGTFAERIIKEAGEDKCFVFYISTPNRIPDSGFRLPAGKAGIPNAILNTSGRKIVPAFTRIIDLTESEDEIFAQMKPKGRYNIRVAQKHGVTVEQSNDIEAFYDLILQTSKRDKFKPLPKNHYQAFLENLSGAFMLLAYAPNELLTVNCQKSAAGGRVNCQLSAAAGLIGTIWNNKGIYYYGASSYEHRHLMAPYLLQLEAMRFCKNNGCVSYDLLGIAPPNASEKHPWKGISGFKEKFGGEVVSYPEEKAIVLKPFVKKIIEFKRTLF